MCGGGEHAPSTVVELVFVEMTQAVQLDDVEWRQVSTLRPGDGRGQKVAKVVVKPSALLLIVFACTGWARPNDRGLPAYIRLHKSGSCYPCTSAAIT